MTLRSLISTVAAVVLTRAAEEAAAEAAVGQSFTPPDVELQHAPTNLEALGAFRDSTIARAYDVSDPIYTCPKSGYTLVGDECIYETRVESRFDCPAGFNFNGSSCVTTQPIQWRCHGSGTFVSGKCQHLELYEADLQCPVNAVLSAEGICTVLDAVNFIDVCPEGTIRSPSGCLAVEYHEPVFVCPPDTFIEGRKCRREVVSFKYKKARMLTATDAVEELESPEEQINAMFGDIEGEADAAAMQYYRELPRAEYAYVLDPSVPEYSPPDHWLPAAPAAPAVPAEATEYLENGEWGQIPVGAPVMEAGPAFPTIPGAPAKAVKAKPAKKAMPQQVVKVITQAAEKICPVGTRYGSTCITETIIPAVKECPVPLVEGLCARRVATAPVATCPYGSLLNCMGRTCKCERLRESLPFPTCRTPGFELLEGDQCVQEVVPRRLCPLGFFIDGEDGRTCVRRDVEPALTLFSVTYACTDCAEHLAPVIYKKGAAGRRTYLASETKPERKSRRDRNVEEKDSEEVDAPTA